MPTDVKDKPKRFQITRGKPFPPNSKSVARNSIFGNPFTVERFGHRRSISLHRRWLEKRLSSDELHYWGFIKSEIQELADKRIEVLERLSELCGQNLG